MYTKEALQITLSKQEDELHSITEIEKTIASEGFKLLMKRYVEILPVEIAHAIVSSTNPYSAVDKDLSMEKLRAIGYFNEFIDNLPKKESLLQAVEELKIQMNRI